MSRWIRKGDRVLVVAGNEKGKSGEVLDRLEDRVLVQGINVRKKHARRRQEAQGGGIIQMEVPIHISNVRLCDKEGHPLKVKVRIGSQGEKDLVVISQDGKETLYRTVRKA